MRKSAHQYVTYGAVPANLRDNVLLKSRWSRWGWFYFGGVRQQLGGRGADKRACTLRVEFMNKGGERLRSSKRFFFFFCIIVVLLFWYAYVFFPVWRGVRVCCALCSEPKEKTTALLFRCTLFLCSCFDRAYLLRERKSARSFPIGELNCFGVRRDAGDLTISLPPASTSFCKP